VCTHTYTYIRARAHSLTQANRAAPQKFGVYLGGKNSRYYNTVTPLSRLLLEKLTVAQLVKKTLGILWNPKFHYNVHKTTLLVPTRGQMTPVHILAPYSVISILILYSYLRLGSLSGLIPSGFSPMPRPSHPPWYDHLNSIWWRAQIMKLLPTASRKVLGTTQPPIQWVLGALSLRVKRPGREADNSLPSSAEVKECVQLDLHSPIRLHGLVHW
jgi:hypothetical protein